MTYPVIMFVDTSMRAQRIQQDHDPAVMLVLRIGDFSAHRASAVIVETPFRARIDAFSEVEKRAYHEWLEWVPTRLCPDPAARRRITII